MSILDGPLGDMVSTLVDDIQLGSRAATIRRPGSGGTYDASKGQVTGGTDPTDHSCRSWPERFETTQIPDTQIEAGDKLVGVSRKALDFTPKPDSDLYVEGTDPDGSSAVTWTIKGVHPQVTGESEAAYLLHLRRN